MIRRSSLTITYSDLVKFAEKQASYARQRRNSASGRGVVNCEGLTHDVECAEMLVRMLRKGMPGRQTSFYELFELANK